MKKALWILLAAIFCVSMSGCVSNDGETSNQITEQANEKNVLNMAIFWLDNDVDPINGWNGWTLTRCGIGENLIQTDENMNFKPSIA